MRLWHPWIATLFFLLAALSVSGSTPASGAENSPQPNLAPHMFAIRYVVFTITPVTAKRVWPGDPPPVFTSLPKGHGLPAGLYSEPVPLALPQQLGSREEVRNALGELQREDKRFRDRLLLWGEGHGPIGSTCMLLGGPALDDFQTTVALCFQVQSMNSGAADVQGHGTIRLIVPGHEYTGGWSGTGQNLRLGQPYTQYVYRGPATQTATVVAFCITPGTR